jgi:hypothetical protein
MERVKDTAKRDIIGQQMSSALPPKSAHGEVTVLQGAIPCSLNRESFAYF